MEKQNFDRRNLWDNTLTFFDFSHKTKSVFAFGNEQKGENMTVKIIEKNDGDWSQGEINAIRRACGFGVQTSETMPRRLVLMPIPVRGPLASLEEAIGHDSFVLKEVKYDERWT